MEDPDREPCFHCGEPAAVSASICPHCRSSVLVDVVLGQPVRDGRLRYQLARTLSRVEPKAPPFLELQKVLISARPAVLKGVTRRSAASALAVLQSAGVEGRSEPSAPVESAGRGSSGPARLPVPPAVLAAVAIGVAALAALWLTGSGRGIPDEDSTATAPQPASSDAEVSTAEIAERAGPSTVALRCRQSVGSGFFVTGDLLVTNAHVLCGDREPIQVHLSDGRELSGEIVRRDDERDLALVRAWGAGASPLPMGDAALLRPGERVVMIGAPLGMDHTVHEGRVSHAGRNLFGVVYVQVDANINPGNSGGPLIDGRGNVVGVVTLKVEGASGLGFVLPINYVHSGDAALLGPPRAPSGAWVQMLARAEEEERREIDKASRSFLQPGLLHAVNIGTGVSVMVLKRSTFAPGIEIIPYTITGGGATICNGTVRISRWAQIDQAPEKPDDPPQVRWLRKHGLTRDLFVGVSLDDGSCTGRLDRLPPDTEVVLDRGEPGMDRLSLMR